MSGMRRDGKAPVTIALAVAIVSVATLTVLVRDRWQSPEIKPAVEAQHSETGDAARAAGATVLPTDRSLTVEPKPAGPPRAQPANPY